MNILSLIIVLSFSIYTTYFTYRRREQLTCMAGMLISMTIGMMSSLAIGCILGVLLKPDLVVPTMSAILVGMMFGFASGKPVSLMAAMDGMLAGIMGGMMGSMLGVMLTLTNTMVLFIDVLFIFVMSILQFMIEQESSQKENQERFMQRGLTVSFVALGIGLAVIGLSMYNERNIAGKGNVTNAGSSTSKTQVSSVFGKLDGYQTATVTVGQTGYSPNEVTLKAGAPAKINFKTESGAGCLLNVVSKELGINAMLNEQNNNVIELKNVKPGTYSYTCGMGMYSGKINVL